jgi:hypothetical protein
MTTRTHPIPQSQRNITVTEMHEFLDAPSQANRETGPHVSLPAYIWYKRYQHPECPVSNLRHLAA